MSPYNLLTNNSDDHKNEVLIPHPLIIGKKCPIYYNLNIKLTIYRLHSESISIKNINLKKKYFF